MTARALRSIFYTPPLAVARLGGSDTPQDAYEWREDPSTLGGGLTALEPAVSLRVEADGSVSSFRPVELVFRDGDLLRPVAPFLELWAEYDDGFTEPLTSTRLTELGGTLEGVVHRVEAANRKAARRSGDPACAFTADVELHHGSFAPVELLASSTGERPLVPETSPIPLGRIQAIRPVAGPADVRGVDPDVLRLRFTPAKGLVYGPPGAEDGVFEWGEAQLRHEIVPLSRRTLDQDAAWCTYTRNDRSLRHPTPSDTYDGSGDPTVTDNRSWGVVDDTCDVVITTSVTVGAATHVARSRVFVSPPDYAPDKRPFVSLLDELLDRAEPDVEVDEPLAALEVGDLLRRAFETVSLDNIDLQRRRALLGDNENNREGLLAAADRQGTGDALRARFASAPPRADRASMTADDRGYRDAERNQIRTDTRLPFSALGRDAHAGLTALPLLLEFLTAHAARVRRLIRPPYALVPESEPTAPRHSAGFRRPWDPDAWVHDMRMPPYMRDSDASPLSLTRRQYVQLMSLVDHLAGPAPSPLDALEGDETPVPTASADELFAAFRRTDLTAGVPLPAT